ncbi:14333_t:CDS:2, partial [Gigaspora rosea]
MNKNTNEPQTLYEKYCNAFAYYKQVSLCNPQPNCQQLMKDCNLAWKQIKKEKKTVIDEKIRSYLNSFPLHVYCHQSELTLHNTSNSGSSSLPNNASLIRAAPQRYEEELSRNAVNDLFKNTLASNIISEKNIVTEQETHLKKLKRHAQAQAKLESKKAKKLEE